MTPRSRLIAQGLRFAPVRRVASAASRGRDGHAWKRVERRGKTGHNTRFLHSRQGVAKLSDLNLLRTLTTVSGMTLLSRITGLLRETIKATAFGAGLQMDAFEAAFRLPNLLRRLFAEGAFAQA